MNEHAHEENILMKNHKGICIIQNTITTLMSFRFQNLTHIVAPLESFPNK